MRVVTTVFRRRLWKCARLLIIENPSLGHIAPHLFYTNQSLEARDITCTIVGLGYPKQVNVHDSHAFCPTIPTVSASPEWNIPSMALFVGLDGNRAAGRLSGLLWGANQPNFPAAFRNCESLLQFLRDRNTDRLTESDPWHGPLRRRHADRRAGFRNPRTIQESLKWKYFTRHGVLWQ